MKKVASIFLAAVMLAAMLSVFAVSAHENGVSEIFYKSVTYTTESQSETFKEITFAGRQWIVLKEDYNENRALILMKDNYMSGIYGQTSTDNAKVTYKDSEIDNTMNKFYEGLASEDKNLIALTSFKESVVINERFGISGKPAEYLEAGDKRIDEEIINLKLQGVIITGTQNTYTMDRYVFAPSAKDIMDFGLEKFKDIKSGGLFEYTDLGDYSSQVFFTRSADTSVTGMVYTVTCEGKWDFNHGKNPPLGIRPALNLDLRKVRFVEETAVGSVLSEGNLWIIAAVAVVAVAGVSALVIVKRKKKPALANGEE